MHGHQCSTGSAQSCSTQWVSQASQRRSRHLRSTRRHHDWHHRDNLPSSSRSLPERTKSIARSSKQWGIEACPKGQQFSDKKNEGTEVNKSSNEGTEVNKSSSGTYRYFHVHGHFKKDCGDLKQRIFKRHTNSAPVKQRCISC